MEPIPQTSHETQEGMPDLTTRSYLMFFLLSLGGALVYLNIRENFNMAFFLGASVIFLIVATTGSTTRKRTKW